MASPLSINRVESLDGNHICFFPPENPYFKIIHSRARSYVFLLLYQVEEKTGEDGDGGNGGQTLAVWEPD